MNLDFDKMTNLVDRILKNSEAFCMNIRKFLYHVYEFC